MSFGRGDRGAWGEARNWSTHVIYSSFLYSMNFTDLAFLGSLLPVCAVSCHQWLLLAWGSVSSWAAWALVELAPWDLKWCWFSRNSCLRRDYQLSQVAVVRRDIIPSLHIIWYYENPETEFRGHVSSLVKAGCSSRGKSVLPEKVRHWYYPKKMSWTVNYVNLR